MRNLIPLIPRYNGPGTPNSKATLNYLIDQANEGIRKINQFDVEQSPQERPSRADDQIKKFIPAIITKKSDLKNRG